MPVPVAATLRPAATVGAAYAAPTCAGILHFGVGNFHRAHQAVYLDELFNAGPRPRLGAGRRRRVRRREADARRARGAGLADHRGRAGRRPSAAPASPASMIDFLDARRRRGDHRAAGRPGDPHRLADHHRGRLLHRLRRPASSIRRIPTSSPTPQTPDAPKTVFGLILAGLRRRRDAGVAALHRHVLRQHSPTTATSPPTPSSASPGCPTQRFADWVDDNVAFPNGMVDRITPATTDRERAHRSPSEFGVEDAWPVFCEPFRQWVLEDNFPHGRPALEKVGVQFVDDVAPFELMKIRILNGGHAAIAYPAGLMDIHFVHEAMAGRRWSAASSPSSSATRSSRPCRRCPDVDPRRLLSQLIERRFSNPKIGDTIRRLCLDGSNRQPKFILPTIADRLKAGKGVDGPGARIGALVPLLLRHDRLRRGRSSPTIRTGTACRRRPGAPRPIPAAWLAMADIYGEVGNDRRVFAERLRHGARRALGQRHARDAERAISPATL